MKHRLLIARTLGKKLNAMRRSGKTGEAAASQCECLLDLIRKKGLLAEAVYRKRTKKGEARIGNCIKYDLGSGCRMITIKDGQNLFVPFVGGHDEADLWLEHHRYDKYLADDPAYLSEERGIGYKPQVEKPDIADPEEHHNPDLYEEQLLAKVDETVLKSVFRGLFNKNQA